MMKGWNTMSEKGTSLAQYVEHFGLEILNHGDTFEADKVESTIVNRPDLQILGLFDYFDARRIQVMGKAELTYIMKMSENRRTKVFDDLFSYTIPALVLARNMECPAECLQCARNHGRTLLRTTERTADFPQPYHGISQQAAGSLHHPARRFAGHLRRRRYDHR